MRVDTRDGLDVLSWHRGQAQPHRHDDLAHDDGLPVQQQVVDLAHAATDDVLDGQDAGSHVTADHGPADVVEQRHGLRLRPRVGRQDGVLAEGAGLAGEGNHEPPELGHRVSPPLGRRSAAGTGDAARGAAHPCLRLLILATVGTAL